MNHQLDETDIRILNLLQQDGRMDAAKIAQLVHKTEYPTRQRLLKLREQGYIKRFTAILDRHKVGKPLLVMVQVKLERSSKALLDEFKQIVDGLDQVQCCFQLAGPWDFLLHVTASTQQEYHDFLMGRICELPNVRQVESSFVLDECKSFGPFSL